MKKGWNLSLIFFLVILNLIVGLGFLLMLYSSPISSGNIQIPQGQYVQNIWKCSDVMSYVRPAKNFVENGVIGVNTDPDHWRPIGYPLWLSLFILHFGNHWLIALHIGQGVLFSILGGISIVCVDRIFQIRDRKYLLLLGLIILITGTYWTRIPVVLSDTFFTFFFVGGLCCGILYFSSDGFKWLLLYVTLISIAGLIRPTLSLFPLIHIFMAIAITKKYGRMLNRLFWRRTVLISLLLLLTLNISSFRNYFHHQIFTPSTTVSYNAVHFAKNILLNSGGITDLKRKEIAQIESMKDLRVKNHLQKKFLLQVALSEPIAAFRVLARNAINLFFSNHLISDISRYFGYEWRHFPKSDCINYRTNWILTALSLLLAAFYLWVYCFGLYTLWLMWAQEDKFLVLLIISIVLSFAIPAMMVGGGGSRWRLPFDFLLLGLNVYGLFTNRFIERFEISFLGK